MCCASDYSVQQRSNAAHLLSFSALVQSNTIRVSDPIQESNENWKFTPENLNLQ